MKFSISNIAWDAALDSVVYGMLVERGFQGLEIAPTRIFSEQPYDKLQAAAQWRQKILAEYGLVVPSMQSIWYGRKENLFAVESEREALADYTRKAIVFAEAIGCRNLVFGCPRNRAVPDTVPMPTANEIAVEFFRELGAFAACHGTVIGLEANPTIYGTNFINTTESALQLIEKVGSEGVRLNLDVGTMVANGESVEVLQGRVPLINHVHISEPGLKPIQKRALHGELVALLFENGYNGFLSIEMGKTEGLDQVKKAMEYIGDLTA